MLQRLPFLRRALAALTAFTVLSLPVVQLAHARAMVGGMPSECPDAAMVSHGGAATPTHGTQHHDTGSCDFCSICCHVAALTGRTPELPAVAIAEAVSSSRVASNCIVLRVKHALPFAQAPPPLSV